MCAELGFGDSARVTHGSRIISPFSAKPRGLIVYDFGAHSGNLGAYSRAWWSTARDFAITSLFSATEPGAQSKEDRNLLFPRHSPEIGKKQGARLNDRVGRGENNCGKGGGDDGEDVQNDPPAKT